MSDAVPSKKLPMVAIGLAGLAVALTAVAVAIVVARDDKPAAAPVAQAPGAPAVLDRKVDASEVVKLGSKVESVVDNGLPRGVRVSDAELATALGLEDGDVIVAITGRPTMRDDDVRSAMTTASRGDVVTLYVEVLRGGMPTLMRWQVDGDLRRARYSSSDALKDPFASTPTPSAPPVAPDPDPLLDTIDQVDDTHFKVPRSTVDALLADPMKFARGARVVPAVKNGKPDGFKLYAIRPSSVYARLGFSNGDTVRSVNGHELGSPDDALEAYTKVSGASTLVFELSRRGRPVTHTIEITK